MDTSETFIKMCDCPEIQELHPQLMIASIEHYYKGVYQYEIDSEGVVRFWTGHYFIWLPRQDQLQAMMGETIWLLLIHFGKFLTDGYVHRFTSMEQLWLAFVMKENYNKTWNSEEWIKE